MHPARKNVWFLMRCRRKQLAHAAAARASGRYHRAVAHEAQAADLLDAAREAQRLTRRRADWFAVALVALALAGVIVNYPLG